METDASEILKRHLTDAIREITGDREIIITQAVVAVELMDEQGDMNMHTQFTTMPPWQAVGLAKGLFAQAEHGLFHAMFVHEDD